MTDETTLSAETTLLIKDWNSMILGNKGTHSSTACIALLEAALECSFSRETKGGYLGNGRLQLMKSILNNQQALDIIGRHHWWGDELPL